MTEEEQVSKLRAMARRRVPQILMWSCVIVFIFLAGLGISNRQAMYFIFGASALFLAYVFHDAAPHIKAAARALDYGLPNRELVVIEIDRTTENDSFKLRSDSVEYGDWRFEFIPIGGGAPAEGEQEATIYRLPDVPWPVLVRLSGGIVWPRSKPRKVDQDDLRRG